MGPPALLLLLLLLPVLAPGAASTVHPAFRALGRLLAPPKPTPRPTGAPNFSVRYFHQKVNHFGFSDAKTFKQRYLIADRHWKKDGGSILFYTGNEGDIVWFSNNTGFMWDVAKELNAMLVFAEHRYYGESLPFGEESFKDTKHLNFLTSEQALVDFVELIKHLKSTIPGAENQPVIAIGGSYGGMLAAWLRMKYPHVVIGALAASAPIWQFEDLVPCGMFMKIVTADFKKSGPNCSEGIRKSWEAINRVASSGSGLLWLNEAFHLCSPLTSDDIDRLKEWISETWVNLAMVNYPYECDFLQPLPAWPVKVVCQYFKDPDTSELKLVENVFQALNLYYNYTGKTKCLNISETTTSNLGSLGWGYQACTEMVMPFCTNGIDDMFEPQSWDFKKFSNECFKQWGVRPRSSWISTIYGGKNISAHTNIVFSNGDLDPWYGGGVTKNISDTLVAIFMQNAAHHLDLRARHSQDPRAVHFARRWEVGFMKKWIQEFLRARARGER